MFSGSEGYRGLIGGFVVNDTKLNVDNNTVDIVIRVQPTWHRWVPKSIKKGPY